MKIRPIFAWYDLWVGVFIDLGRRRVYILPIPCCGVVIEWKCRHVWLRHDDGTYDLCCCKCGEPDQ
jgi:hypothetical protein